MGRFIRILIKLVLFILVFFVAGLASGILDAFGGAPMLNLVIALGAVGALTAIVKYKPKESETQLDKSE